MDRQRASFWRLPRILLPSPAFPGLSWITSASTALLEATLIQLSMGGKVRLYNEIGFAYEIVLPRKQCCELRAVTILRSGRESTAAQENHAQLDHQREVWFTCVKMKELSLMKEFYRETLL